MPAGRPPDKLGHVDRLEGPDRLKHRLRVILETLTDERTVQEAAKELGVSEARFHELRHQALTAALEGIAPGRPGRPRKEEPVEASRIHELEREVGDLKVDLQAARVRTEIALTMPHLLRDRKKNELRAKAKRRRKRR
jgi:transposase-like protein